MDPFRAPSRPLPSQANRRLWELEPSAVALVAGILLTREEAEALMRAAGDRAAGLREDALRARLLEACGRPGPLAESVEALLHRRTERFAAVIEGYPMIALAEWWSRSREELGGEDLAALLWRLTCDPRPHLEKLAAHVAGALCIRALDLLRELRPGAGAAARARGVGADGCERAAG